jgi:hypothetical protein
MLCWLLSQDVDLKPALFFDFPKQGLFRIFVKFNNIDREQPLSGQGKVQVLMKRCPNLPDFGAV